MSEASKGPELAYVSPAAATVCEFADLADGELVALAVGGSDAAFGTLMDRYGAIVAGYIMGKTGSESDVEDIGQEVFLSAFVNLPRLRTGARFGPWLMRIARSRLMDHFRRVKRRPRFEQYETASGETALEAILHTTADPRPNPSRAAAASQLKEIVCREIVKMSEDIQTVVFMRLIGECPVREIAERLGVNRSVARMRLMRGMKRLRKALRTQGLDLLGVE